MFTTQLVVSLGIWLDPRVYRELPLLVPYAVRDPHSREKSTGLPDAWGSPNEHGYFRDDNSLVKGVPRALHVASPTRSMTVGESARASSQRTYGSDSPMAIGSHGIR